MIRASEKNKIASGDRMLSGVIFKQKMSLKASLLKVTCDQRSEGDGWANQKTGFHREGRSRTSTL